MQQNTIEKRLAMLLLCLIGTGISTAVMADRERSVVAGPEPLRNEMRLLKERLEKLEQEKRALEDQERGPNIIFSGLIEVEATSTDDKINEIQGSDIAVATVELAADVVVNNWVSGHILFKYEDVGDDNIWLDEGAISIINVEKSPLFLVAGRQYLPFGRFETMMVSDPLTLDYAETREDAVRVGYTEDGIHGSIYFFNGDADKPNSDDNIDNFGGHAGYIMRSESVALDFGIGYINSIADSDGSQAMLNNSVQKHTPGISLHAIFNKGPFILVGEYITAAGSFDQADLEFNGSGATPAAMNFEVGYGFDMLGMESTLAVAHQRTSEALGIGFPETRNMVTLRSVIYKNTELSFEYFQATDYGTGDSDGSITGSDEKASTFTVQLAVGF